MNDDLVKDILRLAVEEGHLTDQQWANVISTSVKDERPLLDLVREQNLLSEELVDELAQRVGTHRTTMGDTKILSPSARGRFVVKTESGELGISGNLPRIRELPADHGFPKDWDRYAFVSLLGEGGMGRVFLAEDPRLKRRVAIKFVRGMDAEAEQRFLNEAQAQAQVSHESLCEIHEVGEVDNRAYIVMAYIEGKSLNQSAEDMILEQKIKVMKEVAEGVHEAHRTGLIHRDIKPSNIMVSRDEGGFKPVVMDFGLARLQSAPGLTETGSIVGTPHYMPPEQARGEVHRLDRRTDVYSLGATLYELLCGKPPFTGSSSVNVLFKVINDEPQPLRQIDPTIPIDLETIALKCMEKDPNKRYDSARALAEDLGRYLDGEPVTARPAGLLYRMRKKAAKNKLAVAVSTVAFLALCFSIAWGLYIQWAARKSAKLTRELTRMAENIEITLRNHELIPIHNMEQERNALEKRVQAIEDEVDAAGRFADGPGQYALGRARLALGETEAARKLLEEAWEKGFREPSVAFSLGSVLGTLYNQAKNELELISTEERGQVDEDAELDRKATRDALNELEKQYLIPTKQYLHMARADTSLSPELLEARLAYYDQDFDTALERVRSAHTRQPWLYEALVLEGQIYMDRGRALSIEDITAASEDYRRARAAFLEAARIGESHASAYSYLAMTASEHLFIDPPDLVEEREELFALGIEACENTLQIDPDNKLGFVLQAELHRIMVRIRTAEGDKVGATANLEQAIELTQRAFDLAPNDPLVLELRGIVYYDRGIVEQESRGDPRFYWEIALSSFRAAVDHKPRYRYYNRLGNTHFQLARYQKERTEEDPAANFASALEAYENALTLAQRQGALKNIGLIHEEQAWLTMNQGEDWEPSLRSAIDSYEDSIEIQPTLDNLSTLGNTYIYLGIRDEHFGENPIPEYQAARDAFLKAESKNKHRVRPKYSLARTAVRVGMYRASTGGDPRGDYRRAIEVGNRGLAIHARDVPSLYYVAMAHLRMAEFSAGKGLEFRFDLDRARNLLERIPEETSDLEFRLQLSLYAARIMGQYAEDPMVARRHMDNQLAILDRLSKTKNLNRNSVVSLAIAELLSVRASRETSPNRAQALIQRCYREAENAVALDQSEAAAWRILAKCHLDLIPLVPETERASHLTEAQKILDRLFGWNPDNAENLLLKASFHIVRSGTEIGTRDDLKSADQYLIRALEVNQNSETEYRKLRQSHEEALKRFSI